MRPKPTDPPMVRIVLSIGQQRRGGGVGTRIVSQNLKYLKITLKLTIEKIINFALTKENIYLHYLEHTLLRRLLDRKMLH